MKQKDYAVLVGVLIASIIISVVAVKYVFSSPHTQKVEVVDKITSDFPVSQVQGSDKQFNDKAIDPTQFIQIGNPNQHPFNGGS